MELRSALISNERRASERNRRIDVPGLRTTEKGKAVTGRHTCGKDVLTVEDVDRDGGLGFAGHHAAVVPGVPRAGSLDDEGTDNHEDLLAR